MPLLSIIDNAHLSVNPAHDNDAPGLSAQTSLVAAMAPVFNHATIITTPSANATCNSSVLHHITLLMGGMTNIVVLRALQWNILCLAHVFFKVQIPYQEFDIPPPVTLRFENL